MCSGRRLGELNAEPGQFFLWRFLTREGWWQAHPFSLSAAPNGRWLRMTAKSLGDHSGGLAGLRPGTKVVLEGPIRRPDQAPTFTAQGPAGRCRHRDHPVTGAVRVPPGAPGDMTLLYRASDPEELVFRSELDEIAAQRQAKVYYLVGRRSEHAEYLTPAAPGPSRR